MKERYIERVLRALPRARRWALYELLAAMILVGYILQGGGFGGSAGFGMYAGY